MLAITPLCGCPSDVWLIAAIAVASLAVFFAAAIVAGAPGSGPPPSGLTRTDVLLACGDAGLLAVVAVAFAPSTAVATFAPLPLALAGAVPSATPVALSVAVGSFFIILGVRSRAPAPITAFSRHAWSYFAGPVVVAAGALVVRILLTRGHGGPCTVPTLEPWRLVGFALLGGVAVASGSAVGRLAGRLLSPRGARPLPP